MQQVQTFKKDSVSKLKQWIADMNEADLEYGPTPPDATYEHTDIEPSIAGKFAVWLYRRNTAPQEWVNSALRAIDSGSPCSE